MILECIRGGHSHTTQLHILLYYRKLLTTPFKNCCLLKGKILKLFTFNLKKSYLKSNVCSKREFLAELITLPKIVNSSRWYVSKNSQEDFGFMPAITPSHPQYFNDYE